KTNLETQNIFKDPIQFTPSGGEMIFSLPNGMQAYYLADALGRRLDEAPIAIVSDRNNPDDPVIRNGRSCMSCHFAGLQGFRDDMRPIVSKMTAAGFDRDKALALYRPQDDLNRLVAADDRRFEEALKQAGVQPAGTSQTEPISALSRRFLADVSEVQAAAETGLEEEEFRARTGGSARLIALGYGQLLVPRGAIKRDAWEKNFGDTVRELQLGAYIPGRSIPRNRSTALAVTPGGRGIDSLKPTGIAAAGPIEILRSARTIFVMSRTVYLKPDQLENDMSKQPGFKEAGLLFVRDGRA